MARGTRSSAVRVAQRVPVRRAVALVPAGRCASFPSDFVAAILGSGGAAGRGGILAAATVRVIVVALGLLVRDVTVTVTMRMVLRVVILVELVLVIVLLSVVPVGCRGSLRLHVGDSVPRFVPTVLLHESDDISGIDRLLGCSRGRCVPRRRLPWLTHAWHVTSLHLNPAGVVCSLVSGRVISTAAIVCVRHGGSKTGKGVPKTIMAATYELGRRSMGCLV